MMASHTFRRLLIATLVLPALGLPTLARAEDRVQNAQRLQQLVTTLRQQRQVRVAHPQVAQRLSQEVSRSLGRPVTIKPEQIIQVEYDSHGYNQLKTALGGTIGVGIYPSRAWGHNKLRAGHEAADSVPRGSNPFPSTKTMARVVGFEKMSKRFYEAVFPGSTDEVQKTARSAHKSSGELYKTGANCATFVCKILKDAHGAEKQKAFDGKLSSLMSGGSAGALWNNAVGANPSFVFVYTPKGDFRSVESPTFQFDYKE